jgi:hypothetical protein
MKQSAAKLSRPSSSALDAAAAAVAAPVPPAIELPAEPAAGGPDVCRLQVRLPAGRPVQRRFLKSDPIKLVLAFARSLMQPEQQNRSEWHFVFFSAQAQPLCCVADFPLTLACSLCVCSLWTELLLVSAYPRRELSDEEVRKLRRALRTLPRCLAFSPRR